MKNKKIIFDEWGIKTVNYTFADLHQAWCELKNKQMRAEKQNISVTNSAMIKRQQRINILKAEMENICK